MTLKEAKKELRKFDMTVSKTDYGEFRVNYKGEGESGAYYTDCLEDAVSTGKMMRPNYNLAHFPGV